MNFYALLTFPAGEVCLAIHARDMMAAMDQVNAWIGGFNCGTSDAAQPSIHSISATKPRGVEAQLITNWVKLP